MIVALMWELMETLFWTVKTILVTIAILQLLIAILVRIQQNVMIIFFFYLNYLNKLILFFLIGLSCGNAKYLKNDNT